jgi:hypothetical protein
LKLYENIVVGNFLYGLGCAIGGRLKSDTVVSAVSLLQQTPADKLLGDVLVEFVKTIRLIEFKNRDSNPRKEKIKHKQITAAIGNNENAITISKSVHWFVETNPQSQSFIARIVPYLEAYPRENSQHSLERFIEATAEEAIRKETLYCHEDLKFYLRLVTASQGSGSIGSGALILAVTASGNLKFAELTSMTQLRLQVPAYISEIKREIERAHERERQLAQEREHARAQERQLAQVREIERALGQANPLAKERGIERTLGEGLEL